MINLYYLLYKNRVIEVTIDKVLGIFKNVSYNSDLSTYINVNHITLYNSNIGELHWDISGKADFYPEFIYSSMNNLFTDSYPIFERRNNLFVLYQKIYIR